LKRSFVTVLAIVSLSLLTWLFFYLESVPLNPSETTIVVSVCAGLVLLGKWAWLRLRGAKEKTKR